MKTEKTDAACLLPSTLVEFFAVFLRSLTTARLYASGHALFRKTVGQLRAAFAEAIKGRDFLFLGFAKGSLFFEDGFYETKDKNTENLIGFFHSLGISHIFLDKNLTAEELESLIALLAGTKAGQGEEVQASLIEENIAHASLGLLDYRILSTLREIGLRSITESGDAGLWYQLILQPAHTFSISPKPEGMEQILRWCEDEEELRQTLRKIDTDLSAKEQGLSLMQRGGLIGNLLENISMVLAKREPGKHPQFARNVAAVLGGFEPNLRIAILGSLPPDQKAHPPGGVIQLMIEEMSKRELLFLLLDALKEAGGNSSCFNNLLNRALAKHKEWGTLLALVREEAHRATLERRPGSLPLWLNLEQRILHRQETEEFNAEYIKSIEALASSLQIQEPMVEQEERSRLVNTLSPEALAFQKGQLIGNILERPHTPEEVSEYFPSLLQELGGVLRQFLREENPTVVGQLLRQVCIALSDCSAEPLVKTGVSTWFSAEDIHRLLDSLLGKCRTYSSAEVSPLNALCQLFPEKASFFLIKRFVKMENQENPQGRWLLTTLTSLGASLGKALAHQFANASEEEIPGFLNLVGISMDKGLVPKIEGLLGHKNFEIRSKAVEALGRLGSERSVPFLSEILSQKSWLAGKKTKTLQTQAAQALFAIGTLEARQSLQKASEKGTGELPKLCLKLSRSLGGENGRAVS